MSIIRFGEGGSNVYLYEDCDGYINCCFCSLSPKSRHLHSVDEALAHVAEHRGAGDHVPSEVDEYLTNERAELTEWLGSKPKADA